MNKLWRFRSFALFALSKVMLLNDWLTIHAAPLDNNIICPICGKKSVKIISFLGARNTHTPCISVSEPHHKYLCLYCGHYFTPWLDIDIRSVGRKYQELHGVYDPTPLFRENKRAAFQLNLIRYALDHLAGKCDPRILDFGCGPNISPTTTMRHEGHDVRCCDIIDGYHYDNEIFFRYDITDTRWLGAFDAIVSIDVIEHLGNTLEAWRHLNKMLKPDGIMAHCFPTRMHYSLCHCYFSVPLHTSIFSKTSLDMLTAKTGVSI